MLTSGLAASWTRICNLGRQQSASFANFGSFDMIKGSSFGDFVKTESSTGCFLFMPLRLSLDMAVKKESLNTFAVVSEIFFYLGLII